ncbi:MAG TPA: hypothetical protein VKP69_35025, partial [Isosphaeraceae bacterium]|nr:hypothetical protein [Isosphaeraceae bacterium]
MSRRRAGCAGLPLGRGRHSRPVVIGLFSMVHDLAPLWLSLRVSMLATLLDVALGVPLALVLARGRFVGKGLLAGVLVLPLVLPPTVLGYYLLQLLGRRAWLGLWLERAWGVTIVFHWSGAVLASALAA